MTLIRSIITAFSIFSIIPMPNIKWQDNSMRWMLVAFPLVGVVVGGAVFFWIELAKTISLGPILTASVMTIIPIGITGAIHLDGFCDTADAIASRAPKEKKLEILKDPNIGALGAVNLCCYLLLYFSLCTEVLKDTKTMLLFSLIFVLERVLSGLMTVIIPTAKESGMVKTFQQLADVKTTKISLIIFLIITSGLIIAVDIKKGALLIFALSLVVLFTVRMAKKSFGGVTGDISGFLLQCSEITGLFVLAIS